VPDPGLRVNGKFYPIAKSYTLGEAETIERVTGLDMLAFQKALSEQDKKPSGKIVLAFVWHAMHRENPAVTVDEVRELEFDALGWEGLEDVDAGPPAVTSNESNVSSLLSAETASNSPASQSDPTRAASGIRP
jgi:hypothetical protein